VHGVLTDAYDAQGCLPLPAPTIAHIFMAVVMAGIGECGSGSGSGSGSRDKHRGRGDSDGEGEGTLSCSAGWEGEGLVGKNEKA